MLSTDDCVRRLLAGVATGRAVSQRALARELGVALGLTNLLLQRLERSGWIRIVRLKPNRVEYHITPAGRAEQARRSREYLRRGLGLYAETRNRIRHSLERLAGDGQTPPARDLVFLGGGELAEVGYVVLAETPFRLVAVVDDDRTRPFFGVPVHGTPALTGDAVAGLPYDRLVVMSFDEPRTIWPRLRRLGVPESKVHWLDEHLPVVARPRRETTRTTERTAQAR